MEPLWEYQFIHGETPEWLTQAVNRWVRQGFQIWQTVLDYPRADSLMHKGKATAFWVIMRRPLQEEATEANDR